MSKKSIMSNMTSMNYVVMSKKSIMSNMTSIKWLTILVVKNLTRFTRNF